MTSSSDKKSCPPGQLPSQLAEGTIQRAAPSKLTEDQLSLLQQQWSQTHPRLRSDQRSTRSTRSSVSGVQYSRVFSKPVSSSCAGRCPTPLFEPRCTTHPTIPYTSTTTHANAVANMALGYAGVVSPAAVQQQQQQEVLLQTRLTVRRKTDADVATDMNVAEDISPVGRLRHRHTGAGAATTTFATAGRFGTYGGSPFLASSTSSNYSSYAPYTPANSTANARLARTASMPGRCSTPSSTASLAGQKYACSSSSSKTVGNFAAFLHPEDSGSSSSSSRDPKTPDSWTMGQLPVQVSTSGLQPVLSGARTGSAALQPAFSTASNSSVFAAAQGNFAGYSGSSSSSTDCWTPASSASSRVRNPFTTNHSPAPISRRDSNAGLAPLAATASGSYSTYSTYSTTAAAPASARAGSQGGYAGGAACTTAHPSGYTDNSRIAQGMYSSRASSSGGLAGLPLHPQRYSNAGGSICGDDRGYMASVPEVPQYDHAAAAAAFAAAGPMASAVAAAVAAAADGFVQQGNVPGSFLPPLETVLTGSSGFSEGCASPRILPGCMVSLFSALGIRKASAKPRSPTRKKNGQKARLSRKTNGHLGNFNSQKVQGGDSRHEVVTVAPATRLNSLSPAGAAVCAAVNQPVVSRQNDTQAVHLQQQQPVMYNHQQQQQEEEEEQALGYSIAAVGRVAVAAAGVCEPAAAGTGAVKATTVLYNSSPRGIYRYSSPNAGSSHAYLPGGYSYSMGGGPYIPLSSSSSSNSSIRRASEAATAAAAAAGAGVAAMTSAPRVFHDLKSGKSVQLMAQTLDRYSQQGAAGSTAAAAGAGLAESGSRCYRSPSTPGYALGIHTSSGGFAASGFASRPGRGASVEGFRAAGAVGTDYGNSRVSNAGSASNVSSGGSMLTPALLQQQQQQQQQQMASAVAGVVCSRRGSNAGSVISTVSDRTYAEVVSTPRSVAWGTARSVAGSVNGSSRMGQRQLRPVSGKGQLAWQPLQRGGSSYLATQ